ncbi:MAG: sigma-54-dependent Fis family transcriptional regulator [Saprospirales bacterium]|nr:sigma-54-dependent Fis family transcriptional regulator [Saprospirales bacterium]
MPPTLLLIDDELKIRTLLSRILSYEGYEVLQAENLAQAGHLLETKPVDVILCDVKLPDGNGLDFCLSVKQQHPELEIIMLTAYGNVSDGVQAMKNGAFDYLEKGEDNERMIPLLHKAAEKVRMQKQIHRLQQQIGRQFSFDTVIGESEAIREAVRLAKKVAKTDASVLLLGETGTGKEVFAHAIHAESPRALKSFVAVNCSAFSHELLESELFGHKAGAFTGAVKDKKGLFEEAHQGTLFLDEIGEMPLDLQARLLRVLENGAFIKVGDTKELKVDVRILAATNKNLEKEAAEHRFREDLLYRLSVFQIQLPSLAERAEDIPLLTEHFVKVFCLKSKKKPLKISKAFQNALMTLPFKGNIRELRNILERAVILCEGDELNPELLPHPSAHHAEPAGLTLAAAEKAQILRVLQLAHGNKTQAAKMLGIGLTTLYQKLKDYEL